MMKVILLVQLKDPMLALPCCILDDICTVLLMLSEATGMRSSYGQDLGAIYEKLRALAAT